MLYSASRGQRQLHAVPYDAPFMTTGLPLHLRSTLSNQAQACLQSQREANHPAVVVHRAKEGIGWSASNAQCLPASGREQQPSPRLRSRSQTSQLRMDAYNWTMQPSSWFWTSWRTWSAQVCTPCPPRHPHLQHLTLVAVLPGYATVEEQCEAIRQAAREAVDAYKQEVQLQLVGLPKKVRPTTTTCCCTSTMPEHLMQLGVCSCICVRPHAYHTAHSRDV